MALTKSVSCYITVQIQLHVWSFPWKTVGLTRKALWNNCHVFLSCRIHVAAQHLQHWSQQRHRLTWKGQHTQWRPRVFFFFPSQVIYTALWILLFCCWFVIKNAKRGNTQDLLEERLRKYALGWLCILTLCKQHRRWAIWGWLGKQTDRWTNIICFKNRFYWHCAITSLWKSRKQREHYSSLQSIKSC